jgi:hypothetical protein
LEKWGGFEGSEGCDGAGCVSNLALRVPGVDLRRFRFPDNTDGALAGDTTVAGDDREFIWSVGPGVGESSVRDGEVGLRRMWRGSILVGIALGISCNDEIGKSTVRERERWETGVEEGSGVGYDIAIGISCNDEIGKSTVRERERWETGVKEGSGVGYDLCRHHGLLKTWWRQ